jgi:hypothetical protein
MAILFDQKDCSTTRKNLGMPDCIINEGRLVGFVIVPKGWSLNTTTDDFDLAYVNEQIQLGNFVPILDAVEAINNTPEATTEEYQGGILSVVRNGLPQFSFKFVKRGWKYASALYTWNSFQAFDVLFVFETGSIAGLVVGNTLSGFPLGMLNTGTYMFTDGSVSDSVTVTMQITNADLFMTYASILTSATLGFNPNNALYPITDIVLTGRANVSEGKVYFKATFAMNQASNLNNIAISNLRFTIDGVSDTITALSLVQDPLTKEYSFTPTTTLTTLQNLVVQLYDAVAVADSTLIGSRYYKGVTASFNAVA